MWTKFTARKKKSCKTRKKNERKGKMEKNAEKSVHMLPFRTEVSFSAAYRFFDTFTSCNESQSSFKYLEMFLVLFHLYDGA